MDKKLISVMTPCYNEEANIIDVYKRQGSSCPPFCIRQEATQELHHKVLTGTNSSTGRSPSAIVQNIYSLQFLAVPPPDSYS